MPSFPKSILSTAPFSLMTEDELQELWQAGVVEHHEPGDHVDADILSADALHILLDGAIAFGGDSLEPISTPGLLAESGCVLLPFERNLPFKAVSRASTFSLTKEAFDGLLDRGAGAAFVILDHLIEKTTTELRVLNNAVQDLLGQEH